MSFTFNQSWPFYRNCHLGPYEYNGALYLWSGSGNVGSRGVYKSVDGGDTWTLISNIEDPVQQTYMHGNRLYRGPFGVGTLYVTPFNLDTETLESPTLEAPRSGPHITSQEVYYFIVRGHDDYVIFHQGPTDRIMGTDYRRVAVSAWNGSSWTTTVLPEQAGNTSHYDAFAAIGDAEGRAHLFYHSYFNHSMSYIVFRPDNTFSNRGSLVSKNSASALNNYEFGLCDIYSGEMAVPHLSGSNFVISRATAADGPLFQMWQTETPSIPAPNLSTSNPATLVYDNTGILHMFYVRSDNSNIEYVNDQGTGTWTTPEAFATANTQGISAGLINDGSAIGVLYNDGGTVTFDSLALSATAPPGTTVLGVSSVGVDYIETTWLQSDEASSYELQRDGVTIYTGTGRTFRDTGRTPGVTHNYRVRGINELGNGEWSNVEPASALSQINSAGNDFRYYGAGPTPSDWSRGWGNDLWTVESGAVLAGSTSNRLIVRWPGSLSQNFLAWSEFGSHDNSEMLTRMNTDGANSGGSLIQGSGTDASKNGYRLTNWASSGEVTIGKYLDNSYSTILRYPTPASGWFWVRLRRYNSIVMVKTWHDGGSEPSEWSFIWEDDSPPGPGQVGFFTSNSNNTIYYDFIGAASDGAEAPSTHTLPAPPAPADAPVLDVDNIAETSFRLFWTAVDGASEYGVEIDFGDGTFQDIGTNVGTELPMMGMETGVTHRARVWAINVSGSGPISNTIEVTPRDIPPLDNMGDGWTNFSEYNIGSAPNDWTELWRQKGTWHIESNASSLGGTRLMDSGATGTGRSAYVWNALGERLETDLVARVECWSTGGDRSGVLARASGEAGNETGIIAFINNGSIFRLRQYRQGVFTTLDDMSYPFVVGNLYWIRLRVAGSSSMAKVWGDGEAEPSDWMLLGGTSVFTAGYCGVFTFNNGDSWDVYGEIDEEVAPLAVPTDRPTLNADNIGHDIFRLRWRPVERALWYRVENYSSSTDSWSHVVDRVENFVSFTASPNATYRFRIVPANNSGNGPPTEISFTTPEAPMAATGTYITDFSETNPGGPLVGWLNIWHTEVKTRIYNDPASNGNMARNVLFSSARHALCMSKLVETTTDMDVRMRCRGAVRTSNDIRLFGRVDGPIGSEEGVFAELFANTSGTGPQFRLIAYHTGSLTIYGAVDFNYDPRVWYQMRLQLRGNQAKAKVWVDGEAEPGWMIESTLSSTTSGWPGIGLWASNTPVDVDMFSVGFGTNDSPSFPPRLGYVDGIIRPHITNITQEGTSVVINWDDIVDTTGYEVRRNGNLLSTTEVSEFIDTSPPSGFNEYEVRAYRSSV